MHFKFVLRILYLICLEQSEIVVNYTWMDVKRMENDNLFSEI